MIDFASELNEQQYEGVRAIDGPVLVLAGAGSGKTRMLTYKLAYLVYEVGVPPYSILAVTFTNKAAREMRQRVEQLLGINLSNAWVGTFHSMCGKILRKSGEAIGIPRDFVIYDADDSVQLVKEVISDFGLDPRSLEPKKIAHAISALKRKLISPDEFLERAKTPAERTIAKIYARYDELLRKAKAVDFDDMISLVVRMFRTQSEIRQRYSEEFQYILVDEFQDTNESQFAFLRELTRAHQNITVVGDDDQSIYSWRGAQLRNILDFPKYYPGCKIIRLEKNYRSTAHILETASVVIAHNRMRHAKRLYTTAPAGERVKLVRAPDDYAEARYVVQRIEDLMDEGIPAGEIAVLYRINALSRLFEQELRQRGIPYVVVGGVGFYERAEIKDILAYIRLLVNPADDVSLRRIINTPRRGIGATTVQAIAELAESAGVSMYEVISSGEPLPIRPKQRKSIEAFVELIEDLKTDIDSVLPSVLIQEIVERTGYVRQLMEEDSIQARARIENIGQLVAAAQEFESQSDEPTILNFLGSVTLMTDVDRWKKGEDVVNLMTIHAAKGLEFEAVFVVGLELGVFPLTRALQDDEQLEEERRLFYVALTRAKRFATVTYTIQRSRFGSVEELGRSPFIDELPQDKLDVVDLVPEGSIVFRSVEYARPREEVYSSRYSPGIVVWHPFFGKGVVMEVRGAGERTIVTVDFPNFGRKKLVAKFAKLKIVKEA